jgi:hypothetical protein
VATQGTFVLADIGGYTSFLNDVGIEHAKEITTHLFNSLLKCNHGRWKVANIEGDCVFFYREGREEPEGLIEHVGKLYEDFLRGTIEIAQRASCPCGACTRTNDLRLKFIVHAGEFDTQKIGGRVELIGSDVVLAHRLLKNTAPYAEYVLSTNGYSSLEGVTDLPRAAGNDTYDDVGSVEYTSLDLGPLRARFLKSLEFYLDEASAQLVVRKRIDAPPDVVWSIMTDMSTRPEWTKLGSSVERFEFVQGEHGHPGEIYRCLHKGGVDAVHYLVSVDDIGRRTTEKIWGSRLVKDCYMTMEVRALADDRTLLAFYVTSRPAIPVLSQLLSPLVGRSVIKNMHKDMAAMKAFCESASREPVEPVAVAREASEG